MRIGFQRLLTRTTLVALTATFWPFASRAADPATFYRVDWWDLIRQTIGSGTSIPFAGTSDAVSCSSGTMVIEPPEKMNVIMPVAPDTLGRVDPPATFKISWTTSCTLPPGPDPKQPPPMYSFVGASFIATNDWGGTDCTFPSSTGTVGPGEHTFAHSGECVVSALDLRKLVGREYYPLDHPEGIPVTRVEFGGVLRVAGEYVPWVDGYIYHELPSGPRVTSIKPSYASTEGMTPEALPLTITGTGFKAGAKVSLTSSKFPPIELSDVKVENETTITATLRSYFVTTIPSGLRDVKVTNTDGSAPVGKDLFYITALLPGIDVQQGLLAHCEQTPCIADHDTWVRARVFVSDETQAAADLKNGPITARLHVTKDGVPREGSPYRPDPLWLKSLKTEANDFYTPRHALDSLNFRFGELDSLDEGTYDFRLEIDPRNPNVVPAGPADRDRYLTRELKGQVFRRSRSDSAFRLSFIIEPLYEDRRDLSDLPFDLAKFVQSAFPISRDLVRVRVSPASISYADTLDDGAVVEALDRQAAAESRAIPTYAVLVSRVNRELDSCYGGTSFGCYGNGFLIFGRSRYAPLAVAHGLGHQFLLGDTYMESVPQRRSPVNSAIDCFPQITGCPVEHGTVHTLLGKVSLRWKDAPDYLTMRDLMGSDSYDNSWIDRRTWDYLYPKFNSPGSSALPPPAATAEAEPQFVRISGSIDRADAVTLAPAVRVARDDINPDGGSCAAELRDASGAVLATQSFEPAFTTPAGNPADKARFGLALPLPPAAARLVIRRGSTELASRTISPHPPTVQVLSPNGGETLAAIAPISWQAADPDGDPLTYTLLYSIDGSDWLAVKTGTTATNYTWDTSMATGSRSARVMVVANDGWHEATDISDAAFTMPGKAPAVRFDAPAFSEGTYLAGHPVTFAASAFDLEEGMLPASAIAFTSDRQGALGSGSGIQAALGAGVHTVTATATDGEGMKGVASIVVKVVEEFPKKRAIRH